MRTDVLVLARPWWWLLFATSLCIPIQITFGSLGIVLVPHDIKNLVGDANKARYLGITVTIMMVVQICQPVFGSMSDKTRSRFGRRRPYIILGQIISAAALVVMRNATGFWVYCWGYQLYQVGNCVVFATWCAIQPGLHDRQRGIFGGYTKLCMGIGFLFAALLGYAASPRSDGKQYLSHDDTWAILIGLQLPLMLIGIASFSESPGFWKPELDAPRQRASGDEEEDTSLGLCAKAKALVFDIVTPFRQPMYRSLFGYCEYRLTVSCFHLELVTSSSRSDHANDLVADLMWGIFFTIFNNYIEYFLSDAIGPDFSFHLFGREIRVAENAESAVSFYNLVFNLITIVLSPAGGWLADHYDRSLLCAVTLVATAIATFITAAATSYTLVLCMSVVTGGASALGGGATFALTADAVSSTGDSRNGARDFTILLTLGSNLPGVIVPLLFGSLLSRAPSRAVGYRVLWAVAGGCCLLSAPILVCFVKPKRSPRDNHEESGQVV